MVIRQCRSASQVCLRGDGERVARPALESSASGLEIGDRAVGIEDDEQRPQRGVHGDLLIGRLLLPLSCLRIPPMTDSARPCPAGPLRSGGCGFVR